MPAALLLSPSNDIYFECRLVVGVVWAEAIYGNEAKVNNDW